MIRRLSPQETPVFCSRGGLSSIMGLTVLFFPPPFPETFFASFVVFTRFQKTSQRTSSIFLKWSHLPGTRQKTSKLIKRSRSLSIHCVCTKATCWYHSRILQLAEISPQIGGEHDFYLNYAFMNIIWLLIWTYRVAFMSEVFMRFSSCPP